MHDSGLDANDPDHQLASPTRGRQKPQPKPTHSNDFEYSRIYWGGRNPSDRSTRPPGRPLGGCGFPGDAGRMVCSAVSRQMWESGGERGESLNCRLCVTLYAPKNQAACNLRHKYRDYPQTAPVENIWRCFHGKCATRVDSWPVSHAHGSSSCHFDSIINDYHLRRNR